MALFKCKMCGGSLEIAAGTTVIECEYCGTQQTLPKLDDEKRANMYDRANHFRRNNEFDKAMGIYEQILNEDNTDAEAYWSLVLCRYGIEYVEDPSTKRRIPTVNRAQFTSIFDDEDYKSALKNADTTQRSVYETEAKAINEIQKGILAISQKEEPFDVFICYKETDNNGRRTPDSVLAQDLYYGLKNEGFKVFFSRITLEDKLGSAYEPYIFAALNSAKVMVVLGTKSEFFNAVWVKNEWSRYLALIKQGQKKMLIPAYKDMDPYNLPEEFSHLQAQDMSKLGFMQDLIRGIKKIVKADEPKATVVKETIVKETVSASGNATTAALLKRAFLFLEDGDFDSADEYAEKVLDIDPENAQAYLGKLMAELQFKKQEDLEDSIVPIYTNVNYEKAIRFGDNEFKDILTSYVKNNRYYQQGAFEGLEDFYYEKDSDNNTLRVLRSKNFMAKHLTIPNCVTEISSRAFKGHTNLTSITIPDSVTSIEESAFEECEGLTSITIPNSVTSISKAAFAHCKALTSITLPDSLTSIKANAFQGCEGLTDITIPNSVTSIGDHAFYACSSLKNIRIPNSVTSIGESAFTWCNELTNITIPDSMTYIPGALFGSCAKLTSVIIPNSVTTIGKAAFADCESLTNVTLPNNLKIIESSAFENCSNLTSIAIPASVMKIEDFAFRKCSNLTDITIPDNVTNYSKYSFPDIPYYIGTVKVPKSTIYKIDEMTAANQKLEAIKYVRETTGLGLAEAKTWVENYRTYNLHQPMSNILNNSTSKSGCYVATCVYGSYDCPQVWTLRRFRDDTLGSTWCGRLFIRAYYAISPTLVKWFGKTNWFKKLWRGKLDRMVAKLQSNGVEDTPYEDKNW